MGMRERSSAYVNEYTHALARHYTRTRTHVSVPRSLRNFPQWVTQYSFEVTHLTEHYQSQYFSTAHQTKFRRACIVGLGDGLLLHLHYTPFFALPPCDSVYSLSIFTFALFSPFFCLFNFSFRSPFCLGFSF